MSEYQYYEWLAIDRALDSAALREVQQLSSHMEYVTPTSAVVTYSWGDFKHDPLKVLARHFDAFLYTANWGTRILAFRFPKDMVTAAKLSAYLIPDRVELATHGSHRVLSFQIDGDDGESDWIDEYEEDADGGTLGALSPIRRQIALGDYRALYLMWLYTVQRGGATAGDDNDEEDGDVDAVQAEPPIPSGLGTLDASLTAFLQFFAINPHLATAAAQGSQVMREVSRPDVKAAIAKLPRATTDKLLLRLFDEEAQLSVELRQLLFGKPIQPGTKAPQAARRSPADLLAAAKRIAVQAKQREQARAQAARSKALEQLAARESEVWREVAMLLERKTAAGYTQAVQLLVDLRDMAQHKDRLPAYAGQLAKVRAKYGKSKVFEARLKRAGLV